MVTYGDGVADININKLLAFHKKQKTIGTITGVNPVSKYGMIKTDNHYQVTGFVEKPKLNDRINGGFMVFNYEYFEYLKFGEMEHPSFIRLLKKHQLSMYPLTGEWIAIDTYREYEQVNTIWKNNQAFWKIWD